MWCKACHKLQQKLAHWAIYVGLYLNLDLEWPHSSGNLIYMWKLINQSSNKISNK